MISRKDNSAGPLRLFYFSVAFVQRLAVGLKRLKTLKAGLRAAYERAPD